VKKDYNANFSIVEVSNFTIKIEIVRQNYLLVYYYFNDFITAFLIITNTVANESCKSF
jgi:hypothetical protein